MPPLLLDAHLPRALAVALRRRGMDAVPLADWRDGRLRDAADERLLEAAAEEGRALVTLDAATLPETAWRWVEAGRSHAGVLVITSRVNQANVGGLVHAVQEALDRVADRSWQDLVIYAHRRER
jgi:predicted nuclease of predicted toxin-antitoxin system